MSNLQPVQIYVEVAPDVWEPVEATAPLPVTVVEQERRSAGPPQYGFAVSSLVVKPTVPAAAKCGEGYVRTNSVVFTRTGIAPTATKGFQANPGDTIMLCSRNELLEFQVIRASADATIDWEYWTKLAR